MKRVFIQTYGCQMNEYDSQQMLQVLATKGFEPTLDPVQAELIIINSCSVREKSENKAMSQLGRFAALKRRDDRKVLAFGGCVGQTEGAKLQDRFPFLDLVFGTNNYRDLPEMLTRFEDRWVNEHSQTDNETCGDTEILLPSSKPEAKCQAFITITNGCDKFCSYCIVPFTRGREVSRTPESIVAEASALVQKGVSEIMLLGQNVNSYWGKDSKGANTSLYALLETFQKESERGGQLSGLRRLRYTTSHPRDFDEDLARAFQEFPILCEYLHLPLQSGSDQVLRRMRRFYTAADYRRKMDLVRKYRPDIALSTDVIVGFPGETRQDFDETMKLLREVQYDNVYSFMYSERPYTRSANWSDDVPADEKKSRITELMHQQKAICQIRYGEDIGQDVEVLVESISKNDSSTWTGRTRKNRVVHFSIEDSKHLQLQVGSYLWVRIDQATHSWMHGAPIESLKAKAS